ncbi:MAG: DNA translocase FtsK 4TM domain-containing protein [Bacteroidales bacterium]|nr:DNA translocase FtsK 4TM domain-containing protein [Bacteroidales bacterium]
MGKRDTKENNKSGKKKSSFFRDERFKVTIGLVFTGLSILLLLAFISYLFTWKIDQSFEWSKVFSNPEFRVDNWSGKVGAWFANLFLNQWFGIASFTVPFLLLLMGLRLMRIKILPLGPAFRITIIFTILISIWLGYIFGHSGGFLGSGPGGRHGLYISDWLKAFSGSLGTLFILLILTFTMIVFSFHNSFKNIVAFTQHTLDRIKKAFKEKTGTKNRKDITEKTQEIYDEGGYVFETEFPSREQQGMSTFGKVADAEKAEKSEEEIELTVSQPGENGDSDEDLPDYDQLEDYDPTLDLPHFQMPPLEMLAKHDSDNPNVTNEELISNKNKIVETLSNYKIQIDKIKATIGPTVTLYEIVPAPGVRISKIKSLEDDIALSLAALGIRIIAPMPGKGTIGIEVPNQNPEIVSMRSVLGSRKFQECNYDLAVALGKTIANETFVFDLARMPHLLVAGATGQGKSVGLNCIITSLLFKKHPSQLKFVLIDPKKVELTLYSKLEKHYLAKIPDAEEAIITDTHKVIYTLNSLTIEMDQRYDLLKKAGVRNIKEYNHKFIKRNLSPEKGHRYLPYIVVIVDEFADLIMTAGKEVETPLARLAQLARAIGIHLVIATQRPTTNIITGVIKANFPARIAFRVTSMVDSRTILDAPGANQLIGRGDLLFAPGSEMTRLQCAFIDIPEIESITDYISFQQGFPTALYLPEYIDESTPEGLEIDLSRKDSLFNEAARLVVLHQQGSTSLIQRKFSIGYNRAGRIMDQLEAAGIVGAPDGSKPRQVFFSDEYSLEQYLSTLIKQ